MTAKSNGQPTIGVKAQNGSVLLSVLPQLSPLADGDSVERISNITRHIGISYSGLGGDFRVLLSKIRKVASEYRLQYGEDINVMQAAKAAAAIFQDYTQKGGVRPFGVSVLIAGWDNYNGNQLYQVETAGTWWKARGGVIGKNHIKGQQFLEKRLESELQLDDAIHIAISTAKEVSETPIVTDSIHISISCDNGYLVHL
mgnify:CR=1 FL=1